jgi:hypothetical protein
MRWAVKVTHLSRKDFISGRCVTSDELRMILGKCNVLLEPNILKTVKGD